MAYKKCIICNREMKEWGDENAAHHLHLLVTKSLITGVTHTHGDLENKEAMAELVEVARQDLELDQGIKSALSIKEVVFKNRQRIGDMLTFTCGVRDFKKAFPDVRVNVIATAMHIFDHNPYLDRSLQGTPENIVEIGPGDLTNKSNSRDWHMTNAFRMSIEKKLGVHIEQGESRPDIWMTQEEWDSPRPFAQPYWIISTTGEKGWGCKMYPTHKWQEVIDQNPDLTFVQIGTAEDNAPRLKGANVIDHIGKTQSRENGIRDLFKLFLHAEGSIGLVSFHMHLSGALYKPCVVIAGAREPVSFTRYPGHAYISNDGMLPCAIKACWHCNIDACTNIVMRPETLEKKIPKCADIIESEDVTRAIRGYYKGGRLVLGKASDKPKLFKNIIPTPPKVEKVAVAEVKSDVNTYGMKFGGGSLTEWDWEFILGAIKKYNVKKVLEFGAGLSTLLFKDAGVELLTYETNPAWMKKIHELNPKCRIMLWDGKVIDKDNLKQVAVLSDLCFVDGPAGDQPREYSTQMAALYAPIVIVHDAGREWARKYQAQYLEPYFDGPIKGGHRCHMWIKKGHSVGGDQQTTLGRAHPTLIPNKVYGPGDIIPGVGQLKHTEESLRKSINKKFVKIVSTARGWGGCARSVTTIMKFLVDAGHHVQFIPFGNAVASREYQDILKTTLTDVDVALGYGPVKEACDVLLMYADDRIWEFNKPEYAETFSEINAGKKVMMLNYRRGPVGVADWTRGWDQYMFLCKAQEDELLAVYPGASGKTKVLPPCTILEPFLAVKPDYGNGVRIVRHNSQGDSKFINEKFPAAACVAEINQMLKCREDISISMLPGPSFVPDGINFTKVPRTADPEVIARFLGTGNLFWYSLPYGYPDMGPRVILEAMAAGLPCMVDSWSGGAIDRVTTDRLISGACGWITKDKNWYRFVETLTPGYLKTMGDVAKERAFNEFRPEKWMEVLLS